MFRLPESVIYKALLETSSDHKLTKLFQTAVEVTEILYASADRRTPANILSLHNIAFIHGMLCRDLFAKPKSMTRCKIFGRYFHSLTSHASIQYRTIPLCSLNAERQERMLKQAKMITKSTSNQQPNQIIRNVVQRVHEESKLESCDQLAKEESEILKLAHTLAC